MIVCENDSVWKW